MKYEAHHSLTIGSHSFKDLYSQIDFDDLHDQEASPGIVLEMQDRQRYFEGRMLNGASDLMQVCFESSFLPVFTLPVLGHTRHHS